MKKDKKALVVEGGGMRGVFSAGVLNAFGTSGFDPFDIYIGVSAGACNLAAHIAGQYQRNYDIIERYSATSRFISLPRFLLGGHYMDLDWLWEITIREYRLDLDSLFRKLINEKKEYVIVATSMTTGKPVYLNPDRENLEHCLKVSSSLPLLYRNISIIDTGEASDGGISDPIPVIEAYRRGASHITVIRSRSTEYVKGKGRMTFIYPFVFSKHPGIAEAMRKRNSVYMEAVSFIRNPPRGVTVYEITPDAHSKVGRATKNITVLNSEYLSGTKAGYSYIKNPEKFITGKSEY